MIAGKYLFVAGLALGALSGAAGARLWQTWITIPRLTAEITKAVTAEQEKLCLIRVTDAAHTAQASEILRQKQAGAAALEAFRRFAANEADAALATLETLEQEIAAYERALAETGRTCPLDDTTRRWLLGQPDPAGDQPGGG